MAPHTEEYQMTYPEDPRSTLADLLTFYVFLALLEEVRRADRLTEYDVDVTGMPEGYLGLLDLNVMPTRTPDGRTVSETIDAYRAEHPVDTDHMRAEYRAAFPEVTGVQGLAARLAER